MASTATQEQLPASRLVETKSTSASWYDNEPGDRLTTAKREFFSTYSNLKLEEVMPHLHSIVSNLCIKYVPFHSSAVSALCQSLTFPLAQESLGPPPVPLHRAMGFPELQD